MKPNIPYIKKLSIISAIRLILFTLLFIAIASSFLLFFDNITDVLQQIAWLPDLTELQDELNYVYSFLGLVLLIAAIIAGVHIERRISVSLGEFSALITKMRQGKYGKIATMQPNDELGFVIHSLNRLADDLEKANILKRKMLSGIVHELNTPLTTLRGNLEAMAEGIFTADERRVNMLLDEVIHLQRMVNDLRELSLAEAGELPLCRTEFDVAKEIGHVLEMVEPLLTEKTLRLAACFAPGLPPVNADRDRFRQIVANLIINACKFSPVGGRIVVRAGRVEDEQGVWLEVAVCDNGIGIDEKDMPHIFEQFYRAEPSRSKSTGGSGIGLAIVKQLTEAHGGQVAVQSQIGKGSQFFVRLPLGNIAIGDGIQTGSVSTEV